MAVVTRPREGHSLLSLQDAVQETENFMVLFPVLYPDPGVLRTALRVAATYPLSWFDAHLLAYAEQYGLEEILSEDFEHGRFYGKVRVRNPFLA
jgi:predicted nucleic acid-binding protein